MNPDAVSAQNKAMSILVVDDEQSIIDMMEAIFGRYGYHNIHVARSGLEALKMAGIDHPQLRGRYEDVEPCHVDLAIVDIMLPDLIGFDLCLSLKNKISPHLPVLLMTGYPIESQHAKFVESGADDFLYKPFHPTELLARIGIHLTRKRQCEQEVRLSETTKTTIEPTEAKDYQLALVGSEIDAYRAVEAISWSGSSMIFRAERLADGATCVVKMLARHALAYEDVVQRFRMETKVMRKLDHPHLVRVTDYGEFKGCPYYVMDYLEGENLEVVIADQGKAPGEMILSVARQLGQALEYIHREGIVHRDLKPKNVFRLADGTIKLGDFGIAVILGNLRVTQKGYSIGTPVYMAPEQFEGTEVSAATDIYSYGALLYHLITGAPPFSATSAMEMLRKHLTVDPEPLHRQRPELDRGWNELVVNRCLAKQARDRPESMTEVLACLERLP